MELHVIGERKIGSGFRSYRSFSRKEVARLALGNQIDRAAQSAASVKARTAAAEDLYRAQLLASDASPINPTAEGIVKRNIVVEHERATGSAAANAAQRISLGRRVRGPAIGTAKESESGNQAQGLIHGQAGNRVHLSARQHLDALRCILLASANTISGDVDHLRDCGGQ